MAGVNALSTRDAPVRMIVDTSMIADDAAPWGTFEFPWFQANPQELRDPLKLASLVSGAVTAIHTVDGHEQTKSALLKVPHGWRVSSHHHPFSNFDGA